MDNSTVSIKKTYLLKNAVILLLIGTFLVSFCYFFIDKPLALWVNASNFPTHFSWLRYISYAKSLCFFLTGGCYFLFIISQCFGYQQRMGLHTLFIANSIFFSHAITENIKFIFGRLWPNTWTNQNLSLIKNNAYGFHFFHSGGGYESFPSGHTTVVVALMAAIWILYLRLRWLSIMGTMLIFIGLVGMNYHFLGDCVGGFFVAVITSYLIFNISNINSENGCE